MNHIFLSYAREDTDVMSSLRDDFIAHRLNVWTDENLHPGTSNWQIEIERAIRNCNCLVVIMSPDSVNSEWVRREIGFATAHRKPIFPVLARGTAETSVPIALIESQWIDTREDYDEPVLYRLIPAIKELSGIAREGGETPVAWHDADTAPAEPTILEDDFGFDAEEETVPANTDPLPDWLESMEDEPAPEQAPTPVSAARRFGHNVAATPTAPLSIDKLADLFGFTREELELNRDGKVSKRQHKEVTEYILIGLFVFTVPVAAAILGVYWLINNEIAAGTGATLAWIALVVLVLTELFLVWVGYDFYYGSVNATTGAVTIQHTDNGTRIIVGSQTLKPSQQASRKLPDELPGSYVVYNRSIDSTLLSIEPRTRQS